MADIDPFDLGETLHRLAKSALDSGEAASVEEAMALFRRYSLHIHTGTSVGDSPAQQAALLTAVNTACRAFLGGVTVSGVDAVPLLVPLAAADTLADAVLTLGGQLAAMPHGCASALQIGSGGESLEHGVRAACHGWVAMSAPVGDDSLADAPDAFVLAGIAAGALCVAECFQQARGRNLAAGRRRVGLSLWRPDLAWDDPQAAGVAVAVLPASAWLIGLGNLGQAYLWSLGMLPYAEPQSVRLTLQDFDRIAPSNQSTSLLTGPELFGQYKTRAMAAWAERRGFQATIVERRFDDRLAVGPEDPAVALCGVDNALARAALEDTGFERVLEAGLGNGASDFLAIRLHSFPGARKARDLWADAAAPAPAVLDQPAYRALSEQGADRCGLVQLAGRTVGAPFVGALAGAMVVAELVKLANGGPSVALLDMHLRSPGQLQAFAQDESFGFNPGVTAATTDAAA